MSSILKALKKLEDEKSIRKPDSLKIDAEILRGDASRHYSSMTISLLAAFLFICGSGATYLFMKPGTEGNKPPVSTVAPLGTPSSVTEIAPVAEKSQNLSRSDELPKPDKAILAGTDIKLNNTSPSSVATPKLPASNQPAQSIKQSELKRPPVTTQPSPVSAYKSVTAVVPPALKVNGIAFQDESADRVAIVNGVSVSNGSMIEGAKIEDIQKDRVRFSYAGEKFEVALGKSNL